MICRNQKHNYHNPSMQHDQEKKMIKTGEMEFWEHPCYNNRQFAEMEGFDRAFSTAGIFVQRIDFLSKIG